MATTIKRLLLGRTKRTEQAIHERLSKKTGLAVFASDALSSTAYATEEILLVLAVAATAGQTCAYHYVVPISLMEMAMSIREKWKEWAADIDLVLLASPYGALRPPAAAL